MEKTPEPDRVVGSNWARPGSLPASRGRAWSRPCPARLPPSTRHVENQEHVGALAEVCPGTLDRIEHDRGRGGKRHRGLVGEQAVARVDRVPGPARVIAEPAAWKRPAARGSARTAGSPRRSLAGAGSPRGHPGSRRGGRSPTSPPPGTRPRAGSTVVPGHRGSRCRPRGSPGCSPRPTSPRWRSPRRRSIRGPLRRPGEGSPGRSVEMSP